MTAVAQIFARIQQIQAQLAPPAPTATASSGAAFADQLAAAGSGTAEVLNAAGLGTRGTAAGAGPAGLTGDAVVTDARKYLGLPYVFGSNDPDKGLDCSGLVQRVYADLGVKLPRVSHEQAKAGTEVPSLDQARPGDILAFHHPVSHVAIYIGDGMMIAAPHTGDHVKIQKVYTTPSTIRRVVPEGSGVSASGVGAVVRPPGLRNGLAGVPYADQFTAAAARHGVPANLLAAVAKVESGYDPHAVSGAGALGLMQLMPSTARGLGVDPLKPAEAIDGAARLLSRNLKEFGSLDLALAAYNAGGGAVHKYGGIPPFPETQHYVPKVKKVLAALG